MYKMDSENQTNINPTGQAEESNVQSWELFVKTSIPIHENIDWNISQELGTSQSSIQENNTWNRYELKPKKEKKWLYFLLWVLVGILLCLCWSWILNNNWTSLRISDNTINSLVNKISAFGNTIDNVVIDHSKLSWKYATDNSQYAIDFNKDWTLRRTEKYMSQGIFEDHTSFYVWTYEYNNGVYTLYVEWWMRAANTVFKATPQSDGSLRITGWTVHNELFRKKS